MNHLDSPEPIMEYYEENRYCLEIDVLLVKLVATMKS
jgi:hypothetical protein